MPAVDSFWDSALRSTATPRLTGGTVLHSATFKILAVVVGVIAVGVMAAAVARYAVKPARKMQTFVEAGEPLVSKGEAGDLWINTTEDTLHIRSAAGWVPFGEATTAARGTAWFHGAAAPNATTPDPAGILTGDKYLRITDSSTYTATVTGGAVVWDLDVVIKGPTGDGTTTGSITWTTGTGEPDVFAPDPTLGDHYLDTSTTPHTVWVGVAGAGEGEVVWEEAGTWTGAAGANAEEATVLTHGDTNLINGSGDAGDLHIHTGTSHIRMYTHGVTEWSETGQLGAQNGTRTDVPTMASVWYASTGDVSADEPLEAGRPGDVNIDDEYRIRYTQMNEAGDAVEWAGAAIQLAKGAIDPTQTASVANNDPVNITYTPYVVAHEEASAVMLPYGSLDAGTATSSLSNSVAASMRAELNSTILDYGSNVDVTAAWVEVPAGLTATVGETAYGGGALTDATLDISSANLLPAPVEAGGGVLLPSGEGRVLQDGGREHDGSLFSATAIPDGKTWDDVRFMWMACPSFAYDINRRYAGNGAGFNGLTDSTFAEPWDVADIRTAGLLPAAGGHVYSMHGYEWEEPATGAITHGVEEKHMIPANATTRVPATVTSSAVQEWTASGVQTRANVSMTMANGRFRGEGPGHVTQYRADANGFGIVGHAPDVSGAPAMLSRVGVWALGVQSGGTNYGGVPATMTQTPTTAPANPVAVQRVDVAAGNQFLVLTGWVPTSGTDAVGAYGAGLLHNTYTTFAAMESGGRKMTWVLDMSAWAGIQEDLDDLAEPYPVFISIPAIRDNTEVAEGARTVRYAAHRLIISGLTKGATSNQPIGFSTWTAANRTGAGTAVTTPTMPAATYSDVVSIDVWTKSDPAGGADANLSAYVVAVYWKGRFHIHSIGQVAHAYTDPMSSVLDADLEAAQPQSGLNMKRLCQHTRTGTELWTPDTEYLINLARQNYTGHTAPSPPSTYATYGGMVVTPVANTRTDFVAATPVSLSDASNAKLATSWQHLDTTAARPSSSVGFTSVGRFIPPSTSPCLPNMSVPAEILQILEEDAGQCTGGGDRTTLQTPISMVLPTSVELV